MALIVSPAQNEIEQMRALGLDIAPHRKRMNDEALDDRFKDPDDPLRLVFVCAMWLTGFDAPSCSTIYLDNGKENDDANGDELSTPNNGREIPLLLALPEWLTSQSRHSLRLSGSPPSGKLLIPLERRDVRVVEGARLESVCTRNRTKGSNPFLSSSFSLTLH